MLFAECVIDLGVSPSDYRNLEIREISALREALERRTREREIRAARHTVAIINAIRCMYGDEDIEPVEIFDLCPEYAPPPPRNEDNLLPGEAALLRKFRAEQEDKAREQQENATRELKRLLEEKRRRQSG